MEPDRRLIVTADDYGAGEVIDRGIRRALRAGSVTAVSALTNYPRTGDAIHELRREFPGIGVGVHLNLTSGPPLTAPSLLGGICDASGNFAGVARLLIRLKSLDIAVVERELRAQIAVLTDQGVPIDHLNSHHNVLAIYPPFFELLATLSLEFDAPLRTPVATSQTHSRFFGYALTRRRAVGRVAALVGRRPLQALSVLPGTWVRMITSKRRLRHLKVLHPDHLIDALFGRPTEANLRHIVAHLPPGVSELVVHLADGTDGDAVPTGIDAHQLPNRNRERMIISSPLFHQLIGEQGITLAPFEILHGGPPNAGAGVGADIRPNVG